MLRSLLSWMRWRRRTTQADPLAQLTLTVRQEELRLELLLLQVEQLKAEKERLALTEEVRLLEHNLHPPRLVMPEPQPDRVWETPPPQEPTEPDPWTEPPPQEPRQETPAEAIARLVGLPPQPTLSPASES